jgi:hypothetical protein
MAKDPFPRIQAVATILTPVVLGIAGLVLSRQAQETSRQLETISRTVTAVSAMEPYIDLLAGDSPQKAKMAAYALYKLNPTDKRGAVYIILAADRRESNQVLERLANDDPEVRTIVDSVISGADVAQRAGVDPATPDPAELPVAAQAAITSAALKISQSYTVQGWMYLGTFDGKAWKVRQLDVGASLPKEEQEYSVRDDTYLRSDRPSFPLYKLSKAVGVVKQGDRVRILELKPDIGDSRVWARVHVISSSPNTPTDTRRGDG